MYNGSIHIYMVGLSKEDSDLLKEVGPLSSFSHHFSESALPQASNVASADIVFIKAGKDEAIERLSAVEANMKQGAKIILMAPNEAFSELGPSIDLLYDFWALPLSSSELAFHFKRVLQACKQEADHWETAQFLDATIDSIPSLVWYKTRDGVHEKVNSSFCATVNKTKEQVQGQRHAYIWDVEEDDPACIESENEVMSSERTCVSEETVLAGDGIKLLTTYKSPLYDLDGSVMGTVGVGIDVTQEKAYQADLIDKNRTLETIFTSLDCGVLTHSFDGSRILGVNQKALDILGFTSEEEMLSEGFDMIASTVVDEDVERLKQEITNLTEFGDTVSTEYRVRHEDGDLLHVMGNIKVIEKDNEKYYQRFLLDITAQKAHEQEKDRRTKDLIQALSDDYLLVCSFDIDTGKGELLRITGEDSEFESLFLTDPTLEGSIGAYIESRVKSDDREMLASSLSAEGIQRELRSKNHFDRLYRAKRGNTDEYRQATVVRSGHWEDRHEVIIGFRNVDQQIRDQLEQKTLLEEALVNANKANAAKSTFLLNMSHDIRTPMNAIVGFTALAESHIEAPDKVEGYLEKIKTSSDHLLNLINDILDMSRIEQGKVTLDESRCNIAEVLQDLYSMLNQEAASKGLLLEIDTSRIQFPEVVCDRLKVNQILFNLIGNSIKFTEPGGKVMASIEELPGSLTGFGLYRIIVEDTGIGMSEEFIDHIFDPFERERTQTISGIQGSGLGMAIVKSLVDMMGGSIEIESSVGKGSRFIVNLSFEIVHDAPREDNACDDDQVLFTPERASRYHVLLVDDNALNREIAEDLLLDAGFRVDQAVNGQDALDKLREAGPGYFDLILMDIQMPVMNGYEAASAIRAFDDPVLASTPILAVTADAFDEDRKRALEHGMNGHLPKPIDVTKLFGFLDSILGD